MTLLENKTYDEERALYGSKDLTLKHSAFDGPADGESALKESSDITVDDVFCNLRYPFWHDHNLNILNCELTEHCRAALWYSDHIHIRDTRMHGIKALRECSHIVLEDCDIVSPEFGWSTSDVTMHDCTAESEYFMMRARDLRFAHVRFKGKYAFQYIENGTFSHVSLDTKDAFWHARNITLRNCVIKGEYLGWYSDGLTFEHCKIIGTQPLCYCKNLRLIDCEMIETDLAFERSEVEADITTPMISIKNPLSGHISVPAARQIIRDIPEANAEITMTEK